MISQLFTLEENDSLTKEAFKALALLRGILKTANEEPDYDERYFDIASYRQFSPSSNNSFVAEERMLFIVTGPSAFVGYKMPLDAISMEMQIESRIQNKSMHDAGFLIYKAIRNKNNELHFYRKTVYGEVHRSRYFTGQAIDNETLQDRCNAI